MAMTIFRSSAMLYMPTIGNIRAELLQNSHAFRCLLQGYVMVAVEPPQEWQCTLEDGLSAQKTCRSWFCTDGSEGDTHLWLNGETPCKKKNKGQRSAIQSETALS